MQEVAGRTHGRERTPAEAEALVVAVIREHADGLLRVARRFSLCADDAQDAYQRALEIFLRHSLDLDADQAHRWLFRVVRNEAHAVRAQRQRVVGQEEVDLDRIEARHSPSPEDRVLAFDTVARSAEALQRLKPHEVKALWMRASGRSYAEIASECGWTYTKVNRCLTEGRRSFLAHYSTIEAGEECARWAHVLSALADGEATAAQLAELRPHLRNCAACRADLRALHGGESAIAAVLPVGLIVGGATAGHATPGWLTRACEAVASNLHERLAGSMLKLQAAADAVSAGKVAAVAASAAALAGGGLVAVQSATPAAREAGATSSVHDAVAPAAAPVAATAAVPPPTTTAATSAAPKQRHIDRHRRAREFSDIEVRTAPRAPPTQPARAPNPAGTSAVQEFAP